MLEFEILARGFFQSTQLHIHYDPLLVMPADAELHQRMDRLWAERLQQARQRQVPLYDAPLFRFVAVETQNQQLKLTLGNTGYKEYVVTREPDFARHHPRQDLGNALSVCSVVETNDDHILLDKREGVDVYVGRYHVIGGFFEQHLDVDQSAQPDPFAAICREIHEETGILAADISAQACLGLVYDLLTPHAELCFFTHVDLSLAAVRAREPLDREIKHLSSLHVTARSLRAFLLAQHGNISATGEPNLLLYGAWKFGEAWFTEVYTALQEQSFEELPADL